MSDWQIKAQSLSQEAVRDEALAALRQKYKAASPEERHRLIHEHDCPTAWTFYNKHAIGSKLCPSCFTCGRQELDPRKRAIKHMELPDIYVCESCAIALKREPNAAAQDSVSVRTEMRRSATEKVSSALVDDALKPAPAAPDVACCCAAHHPNYGRCLQCPIHGTLPPGASDD